MKNLPYVAIAYCAILPVLYAPLIQAHSVYISADSYGYETALENITLDYQPLGGVVGGSFGVSDDLHLQYQLGLWNDGARLVDGGTSDFQSTLYGVGLSYDLGNWGFSIFYSDISDEISAIHGDQLTLRSTSDVDAMSFQVDVTYGAEIGPWVHYYKAGLQYDDTDSITFFDQTNQRINQRDDSLLAMAKAGADYYLASGDNSGLVLGAALSWYSELSSDQTSAVDSMPMNMPNNGNPLPQPPPRAGVNGSGSNIGVNGIGANGGGNGRGNGAGVNGGANINRTLGESYGLLSVYTTYYINRHWSLDWNTSIGFAGDENANSHALTLSYGF